MQHHFPGFLIAIEGIDGTGKTTQAHHVQELLQSRGLPVIRTKEPTTGHWGQILRDSALTGRLSLEEEVDAFIEDRKEHVDSVINPELKAGKIIILDRYYFSNMAYQGARGFDIDEIMKRNEAFAPEPDLLVILDLEPGESLQRIKTRGDRGDHFEEAEMLQKARQIFLNIKKPYMYRIPAMQTVEQTRNLVVRQFSSVVAERIATSNYSPDTKLNQTFKSFAGDPL
jgi:dTMP kinase